MTAKIKIVFIGTTVFDCAANVHNLLSRYAYNIRIVYFIYSKKLVSDEIFDGSQFKYLCSSRGLTLYV